MSYLLPGSDHIRVYTRKDWYARQAGALHDQKAPTEAFLHHTVDASPETFNTLAKQKARMRGIQAQHMDANGWQDGGYHFVVFQPYGSLKYARIFELRDWRKIPAAQANHNTATLAVCTVGDFRSDDLKRNTRYAIGLLLKSHDAGKALKTVGGHRDVVSTECPGPKLYRWVDRIADLAGLDTYK